MQKLDTYIDENGGTPKAPKQTTDKTRDGAVLLQAIFQKAIVLPKLLILLTILQALIHGGNVLGLSITVEKKLVSTLTPIWGMVINGWKNQVIQL